MNKTVSEHNCGPLPIIAQSLGLLTVHCSGWPLRRQSMWRTSLQKVIWTGMVKWDVAWLWRHQTQTGHAMWNAVREQSVKNSEVSRLLFSYFQSNSKLLLFFVHFGYDLFFSSLRNQQVQANHSKYQLKSFLERYHWEKQNREHHSLPSRLLCNK